MEGYEVAKALEQLTIIVDTREQNTSDFKRRVRMFSYPIVREKLNFGDYSVKTVLRDGTEFSLADKVVIERKMSLDELAGNFTHGRDRFCREFNRATKAGAKVYLICEDGSYEKIALHNYRSQYDPKAFLASLCVWESRYNCKVKFVSAKLSPSLIKNILLYEMREALKNAETDSRVDKTVSADD